MLAFGTQVRGFKPGRSRQIFQGEKILSTPSFGREVNLYLKEGCTDFCSGVKIVDFFMCVSVEGIWVEVHYYEDI